MPEKSEQPLVSILMLAYKHECYVAQAIESVLMQRTSFRIELVIGEDSSPDATRHIAESYAERFPEVVRLLPQVPRLGMMKNLARTYGACTGKYVAMLEGDDYWTDPNKLRLQVEAMEAHPDWSGVFHSVRVVTSDAADVLGHLPAMPQSDVCTLRDLFAGNPMPACSVLFRRGIVAALPEHFATLSLGDWPLWILHAVHGPFGFIDKTLADYRVHNGGVWSALQNTTRHTATAEMFLVVRRELARPWRGLAAAAAIDDLVRASRLYLLDGQRLRGFRCLLQASSALRMNPSSFPRIAKAWIDSATIALLPTSLMPRLRRSKQTLVEELRRRRWLRKVRKHCSVHRSLAITGGGDPQKCISAEAGCIMERDLTIWLSAWPGARPVLNIRADAFIGQNAYLGVYHPITIGRSALIGAYSYIVSGDHQYQRRDIPIKQQGFTGAPVSIEDDAWLGTHVVVLPGVTVGKGAIVGAGSVVTRNIPAYEIWAGAPAKFIKHRPA